MIRESNTWSAPRCIVCMLALAALVFVGAKAANWLRKSTTPEEIALGQQLFEHEWTPGDPLAGEGDGLGPVFNARSCKECHFQGGVGGAGPNQFNVTSFEVAPVPARPQVRCGVVHADAVAPHLKETADSVQRTFPFIRGGTRIVDGCTVKVGDFDPVAFNSINTPALFGAGLIDEISDTQLHTHGFGRTAQALSKEIVGDFSTTAAGRLHILSSGQLGRFGWKGQFATLEDFVAAACAVEMGLTNPYRQQDLPLAYKPDGEAKLDITQEQFDALVAFVRALPRPEQLLPNQPKALDLVRRGEEVFAQVGCADCHIPDFGGITGIYSDFRLHRVEDENATGSYVRALDTLVNPPDTHPKPDEWKTPPLWGIADSGPYFHDGGSATLEDAIVRHDLQAKRSREKFAALKTPDRKAVMAFLSTLRAPQAFQSAHDKPTNINVALRD